MKVAVFAVVALLSGCAQHPTDDQIKQIIAGCARSQATNSEMPADIQAILKKYGEKAPLPQPAEDARR